MSLVYALRAVQDASPPWVRRAAGAVFGHVSPRWRYGRAFRSTWDVLESSRAWSRAEREAYQMARLREVLALAGRRVPHYRRVFAREGFAPERLTGPADLQALPLLTRDDVRHLGEDLLPDGQVPRQAKYSSTAGTTGKPLGFWITHDSSAAEWAFMLHSWLQAGYRPGDWRVVVRGRVVSGRESGRHHEVDPLNQAIYLSSFDLGQAQMPAFLDVVARYRPRFLHAYPSSATVIAQYLEAHGLTLPSVDGLLIGSENIYPGQRAYLQRVFGCRLHTWYGHSEKCIFAPGCPCGRSYSPVSQYGVTELVDADGRPVTEPGRPGLLVGTGFINRGTIFVRYLTDDQAEWVDGACPGCGATGPLLTGIVGRWNQEFLVGRSGAMISVAAVNLHTRVYTSMRQFQFYQDTPGEVVLRLVKADGFRPEDEEELRRELEARLAGEVTVRLEEVADLPLSRAGKFKWVDQRVPLSYPSWDRSSPEGGSVRTGRGGAPAAPAPRG